MSKYVYSAVKEILSEKCKVTHLSSSNYKINSNNTTIVKMNRETLVLHAYKNTLLTIAR